MTKAEGLQKQDLFSFECAGVHLKRQVQAGQRSERRICGDNSKEDTPVPIPNTEVKLLSADDTWWGTAWESRTLPLILVLWSSG